MNQLGLQQGGMPNGNDLGMQQGYFPGLPFVQPHANDRQVASYDPYRDQRSAPVEQRSEATPVAMAAPGATTNYQQDPQYGGEIRQMLVPKYTGVITASNKGAGRPLDDLPVG